MAHFDRGVSPTMSGSAFPVLGGRARHNTRGAVEQAGNYKEWYQRASEGGERERERESGMQKTDGMLPNVVLAHYEGSWVRTTIRPQEESFHLRSYEVAGSNDFQLAGNSFLESLGSLYIVIAAKTTVDRTVEVNTIYAGRSKPCHGNISASSSSRKLAPHLRAENVCDTNDGRTATYRDGAVRSRAACGPRFYLGSQRVQGAAWSIHF